MKTRPQATASLTRRLVVALIIMGTLLVSGRAHSEAVGSLEPAIQITIVPSKGAGPERMETIAGTVGGVNLKEHKVVIFCRTNTWYVQPLADLPYTSIDEQGKWETGTHLGDEYAALLVKPGYKPPATTDTLPPIGGDVLAVAQAPAKPRSEPHAGARK